MCLCFFFFFQAEDGIRDHCVTGVQTCALPILNARSDPRLPEYFGKNKGGGYGGQDMNVPQSSDAISAIKGGGRNAPDFRSEERRVGKECRSRWAPEQ